MALGTFLYPLRRRAALAGLMLVCLLIGANAFAQNRAQDLSVVIEQQIISLMARDDLDSTLPRSAVLQDFYSDRAFQPVWVDADGTTAKGHALLSVLAQAGEDGLQNKDYAYETIDGLLGSKSLQDLGALEVLLSRAVIDYAEDSQAGRVRPKDLGKGIFIEPQPGHPLEVLNQAAGAPDVAAFLQAQGPQSPEYRRLKAAFAHYRTLAETGGWTQVPAEETLKPGERFEAVPALRQRLLESGDLASESETAEDPRLFDATLEAAVIRFQNRHGLEADGVVGRKTRAALNVSAEERARQMLLNMERRRWMQDDLGETYIFVNLADFELKVVDGAKTIHDDQVVVGTRYNKTPIFSDRLSYLVFNPYWHITPNIARFEMLPKIQKDIGYLADNNITVLSDWSESAKIVDPKTVDWQALSSNRFPYKLRQEPGGDNALGRIKFIFPNEHNIYLHDTPARALFGETVRSFSHGCIRVNDPLELAKVLLRLDPTWSPEKIEAGIDSGDRKIVPLKQKIPIHLTYLTAWVNKDGTVHFRDDIYDRDQLLASALGEARMVMASAE